MHTSRKPVFQPVLIFLGLLLGLFVIVVGADAAWIRETYSNFDLCNVTETEVNDVEITLGGITLEDVLRLYAGDAARGWIPHVEEGNGEITLVWKAPENSYLKPGEWLHLGFLLRAKAPYLMYAKATWTVDDKSVATVPFVWHNWAGHEDSSVDHILMGPAEFPLVPGTQKPDSLIVTRRWAASKEIILLSRLTREDPEVRSLDWSQDPRIDTLTPDSEQAPMRIPPTDESIPAVLVQYTVALESTGEVAAVFTDEAHIVHEPQPQPRIVKPVDNLKLRPDLVHGTVNLWATERTGLWDDGILVTRFWFSADQGEQWTLIAEDDDGSVPTFSTFPETSQHNWWSAQWNTADLREGDYLLKVSMMDDQKNVGEDIIEVYVDPTPPIPLMIGLDDHQVFRAPTDLLVETLDEDIVSVIWEAQLKLLYYTKGIPDFDQHDYGVGQANNGNMYCAPTGSAACLAWWADHGYPKLTQDVGGNPLSNTDLVEGLADEMGTSSLTGTSGPGIINGLRQWVNDRGLSLTVTEHATINPTTIRNEVENCKEDVILGILWNNGGGHIVTVDSIANFTNEDGTTDIGLMDPWVGNTVDITMEADGDVHWPGRAGVQDAALMVTVSPTVTRIQWIRIGEGLKYRWDPMLLQSGLYFLRATMTDSKGNKGYSQIIARVGQPLIPVMLREMQTTLGGGLILKWQETDPGKYAYVVEYCDDLASGDWQPLPGRWPIPDTSFEVGNILDLKAPRYYRVMKDYEPK